MEGMLRQDSPESKGTETIAMASLEAVAERCGRIPPNRRGLKQHTHRTSTYRPESRQDSPESKGTETFTSERLVRPIVQCGRIPPNRRGLKR